MKTQHGILTPECVLMIQNNKWVTVGTDCKVESISDLLRIADSAGLTHLWVPEIDGMPEPDEAFIEGWEQGKDDKVNFVEAGPYAGLLKSVHRWGTKERPPMAIIFPEHTRWADAWGGIPGDKELLVTIAYMEQALGVPIGGSPSTVGWNLLKKMHPEWVKNFPKVNLELMHFGSEAAADLVATLGKVQPGQFLHKVDRNSAYLASSATEFYGVGDPAIDSDGSKYKEGAIKDGHRPGVWQCRIYPGTIQLPRWSHSGLHWLADPIIRLMRKVGYEVEILNGWYFPECHQILGKWSSFLWDTRMSFQTDKTKWKRDAPRENARQGIKMIAVATIGLTAFKGFEENEESSKKRPDIRMQTVARTYELVYHNMLKFFELTGMMPVMIYTDALYYATNSSEVPFPDVFLKRDGKLGGYKYEGRILITPELADMINSEGSVSDKLAVLNKIGWSK